MPNPPTRLPLSIVLICTALSFLAQAENLHPVIGIVTLPVMPYTNLDPTQYSYFAASYASFIEGGGARAAVIPWQASNLSDYVKAVNGIFFTGGSANLSYPNNGSLTQYGLALQAILETAIEENEYRYFPLWGTCQGHEALAILLSRNGSILGNCTGFCIYVNGFNFFFGKKGRMFADMPLELAAKLAYRNLTIFDHNLQLDYSAYTYNTYLNEHVEALLYSFDGVGTPFISAMEHRWLPIYSTQFHPEKAAYEWNNPKLTHSYDAIRVEQYLANFLVQETRKDTQAFNETEHEWLLIYNYQAQVVEGSPFSSMFIFNNSDF